jgi:hypothetical protein
MPIYPMQRSSSMRTDYIPDGLINSGLTPTSTCATINHLERELGVMLVWPVTYVILERAPTWTWYADFSAVSERVWNTKSGWRASLPVSPSTPT